MRIKGTGKTRTLVAAIQKIVRETRNAVLVCANSNAACDEITKRLLNVLRSDELFRVYAKSYDEKMLSDYIKPISNFKAGKFEFPSIAYLNQFRVVICTLSTAGCIARARDLDPDFDSCHFSHIFIDEAACVLETVSLIAIAGNFLKILSHSPFNFSYDFTLSN